MSDNPLCISSFAEIIRHRMKENSHIKKFDIEAMAFQSERDARRDNAEINLSKVAQFYTLLLESLTYQSIDGDLPDLKPSMMSDLKRGKREAHNKIKELAQQPEAKKIVAVFFRENLIPNIPASVLSTVLDEVDLLIQNDKSLGRDKRNALKQARSQCKDEAIYLADILVLAICNGKNKRDISAAKQIKAASDSEFAFDEVGDAIDKLDDLLKRLPRPPNISPPVQQEEHEFEYITALYAAYGDAEGVDRFCETSLQAHPQYQEDLDDRRIDYFAAESINRGVSELGDKGLGDQFDLLKEDTYAGVVNTARRKFDNGYERMLVVMEKAVNVPVAQYVLSRSPYWINNRIKMGACHFLVKDGKLKWVKK